MNEDSWVSNKLYVKRYADTMVCMIINKCENATWNFFLLCLFIFILQPIVCMELIRFCDQITFALTENRVITIHVYAT